MPNKSDEIKAILEDLSTSDLPLSARMVAVLHALGVEAPADLERLMGLRPSSVRQARRQLAEYRCEDSAATQRAVCTARLDSAPLSVQRGVTAVPRARAYKESPSEIVNKKIKQQTTTRDLSSLNGSTDVVVGFVSSWMTAYYPDERDAAARTWIASEIARTSADAVKQAILLTANKIQRGEIVPKPLNYATHTATNLCKEAAAGCVNKPTALEAYRAAKAAGKLGAIHG